jgi:hypothetical protein
MRDNQLPLAVREALLEAGFDNSGTYRSEAATINIHLSAVFGDILIVRISQARGEDFVHRLDLNHLATLSRETLLVMFDTIKQFAR